MCVIVIVISILIIYIVIIEELEDGLASCLCYVNKLIAQEKKKNSMKDFKQHLL